MVTLHHQLAIVAPIEKVYSALSSAQGVSTWWDKQTAVETSDGLVLEHNPGAKHGVVRLKVLKLDLNKCIEWKCISSHSIESPAHAWTGTHFIFELSETDSPAAIAERECAAAGEKGMSITTVDFRQTNYDSHSPFAGFNNFAWASVLSNLKNICESRNS